MANKRVALVTLGCARNEVDSDQLAARLTAGGYELVADAARADAVVVNTCGFIEAAQKESVDTLLDAASLKGGRGPRAVVAVGCLAERYGDQLAASLPEADAVLGFDHYPDLAARIDDVLAGRAIPSHTPADRRLLPIVTDSEPSATVHRRRMTSGPVAPLKLASGCDRRCTFCAIPFFRGAFVSRSPAEVLSEARWLAADGVRELYLVSENTTAYGKDLGDVRLLERLLPEIAAVPGIARVRLSYLQPAEMRPSLVTAIASTPGVAAYFDLSFQHASAPVLKRMRRFGDRERFLTLLESVRAAAPHAGVRSNFIVGFPGETKADVTELERFLGSARLDAAGFFGFSPEPGTEAETYRPRVRRDVVDRRLARMTTLAEVVLAERAAERIGTEVEVLVESVRATSASGRAEHQAPEVDGTVTVRGRGMAIGDLVRARVIGNTGVDLTADLVAVTSPAAA